MIGDDDRTLTLGRLAERIVVAGTSDAHPPLVARVHRLLTETGLDAHTLHERWLQECPPFDDVRAGRWP